MRMAVLYFRMGMFMGMAADCLSPSGGHDRDVAPGEMGMDVCHGIMMMQMLWVPEQQVTEPANTISAIHEPRKVSQ